MRFVINQADGYLRGDLYERRTAEETREFLLAMAQAARTSRASRALISVHASQPVFRVQQYGLPEFLAILASRPDHRVAIVADDMAGRLCQQYVVTLAKLSNLNVESFTDERRAIAWLRDEHVHVHLRGARPAADRGWLWRSPFPGHAVKKAASSRRILVVEDNLDSVQSLVVLLRDLGHEVDFAIDGYIALETLSRTRPDFVFLDLGLPGIDGFDVCERIKRDPALRSTRVVAVTAYAGDEYRERARAAGFEFFIVKPVGIDFFEDVLR